VSEAPQAPRPSGLRLRRRSRVLEISYADGTNYALAFEYLRISSPSAEVRGHHPSQAVLQTGKKNVDILEVKQVGHYALQIVFDDGHDSGIYSWDYLYLLCTQERERWQAYLEELRAAGASRDPDTQVLHFDP
jgi:DUF971 family protein